MSSREKLIVKLKNRSNNFTYRELQSLLLHFGYRELKKGKTSGSRRAFYNQATQHIIRLHKPHPADELKAYQRKAVIKELIKQRII